MNRIAQIAGYAFALFNAHTYEGEDTHLAGERSLLVRIATIGLVEQRVILLNKVGEEGEEGVVEIAEHGLAFNIKHLKAGNFAYFAIVAHEHRLVHLIKDMFQRVDMFRGIVQRTANIFVLYLVGLYQALIGLVQTLQVLSVLPLCLL